MQVDRQSGAKTTQRRLESLLSKLSRIVIIELSSYMMINLISKVNPRFYDITQLCGAVYSGIVSKLGITISALFL